MRILSIEQSTRQSSAAILADNSVLAEARWESSRPRNQELFLRLPSLFHESGVSLDELDAFAVGTGPGSFAGVRSSIATAQSMAMPGMKPVIGVGSTEVMARVVFEANAGKKRIVIVGDARRKRLWLADLHIENGMPAPAGDVVLIEPSELGERLAGGAVLATPDWNRIGDIIMEHKSPSVEVVEESVAPRADIAGRIAAHRLITEAPIVPAVPAYLHPPVFVEPRP